MQEMSTEDFYDEGMPVDAEDPVTRIPEVMGEIETLMRDYYLDLEEKLGIIEPSEFVPGAGKIRFDSLVEGLRRKMFLKYYGIDVETNLTGNYRTWGGLREGIG
jgi:hypothetical protein